MSEVVIASASTTVIASPQVSETELSSLQVPETFMYKNRLQEFAQKSGMPLPVYRTIQEGPVHQARFRCTVVLVNGVEYTSSKTFRRRKSAEQDAARQALEFFPKDAETTDFSHIPQDPVFSKSILNEYAAKMKLHVPVYTTSEQQGLLPVFISSVVFNGASYTSDVCKNKKDAEQLAARAAVLSLLGENSESKKVLSEIIRSKHKLYVTLHPVKNSNPQNERSDIKSPVSEREKSSPPLDGVGIREPIMPIIAFSEPGQVMNHETNHHQSLHIFKSPKPEQPSQPTSTPPPILFVPSSLGSTSSNSGKKRKRKNKKKDAINHK